MTPEQLVNAKGRDVVWRSANGNNHMKVIYSVKEVVFSGERVTVIGCDAVGRRVEQIAFPRELSICSVRLSLSTMSG